MKTGAYEAGSRENFRENFKEGEVRSNAARRSGQMATGKLPIRFRDMRVMGDLSLSCFADAVKVKTRLEWVGARMGGEETDTALSRALPGV